MPYFAFYTAAGLFAAAVIAALLSVCPHGKARRLPPLRTALICFFTAGVLLHFPLYAETVQGETAALLKALLPSLYHTLQLFVLGGELDSIRVFSAGLEGWLSSGYFLLTATLYLAGPMLTFSTVLSFFKSFSAFWLFQLHFFSETFLFSELNEQSLCLADSLKRNHPGCLIVFTDVNETDSEEFGEQREAARRLGAACFKTNIAVLRLGLHRRTNRITFFLMGSDEGANVRQAVQLVRSYGGEPRMALYLFAAGVESELLFQAVPGGGMKVRRINESRALVDRILYEDGKALFESALGNKSGEKQISALLLGLGRYGTEMLKGLSWYGQMEGYRLELTAFDRREDAGERFSAQCPELMSPAFNGTAIAGEAQYRIDIRSGVDIDLERGVTLLEKLENMTYIFIALGSDTENIAAAVTLREICERLGRHPCIYAVVYDDYKANALRGAVNYRGTPYDIHFVGGLRSFYSEKNLLDSRLEQAALQRHLQWGDEDSFWRYEFNYRSSVASVIHLAARRCCGIPGAEKPIEKRTPEERELLRLIEHRRWNAYMRSEGYRYSGSRDRSSRNDLAKLHPDLAPYHVLSESERKKDDV